MTENFVISSACLAFLLTCLLRGMTVFTLYAVDVYIVSTHMPLARHDGCVLSPIRPTDVSTHMPLARHDRLPAWLLHAYYGFYSHASCEAWLSVLMSKDKDPGFYSHASCEAWPIWTAIPWNSVRFYSHASCEAWRLINNDVIGINVSTHMPLARHDLCFIHDTHSVNVSTHMPLARHDYLAGNGFTNIAVSTHMPLARHDHTTTRRVMRSGSFYSHASCEAWPWCVEL